MNCETPPDDEEQKTELMIHKYAPFGRDSIDYTALGCMIKLLPKESRPRLYRMRNEYADQGVESMPDHKEEILNIAVQIVRLKKRMIALLDEHCGSPSALGERESNELDRVLGILKEARED